MVMTINPPPLIIPADAPPGMREYIEYLNTLLRQISQAIGPTGVIGVENGGTNITEYAIGDLLVATAATVLSKLNDIALGNVLLSGGVGETPFYGKVGLTSHISGILPIANGGTNRSTIGSADQLSGVNAAADAIEYKTLAETTDRTTVVHGIGSITLDISANYVGQTSITTLGTIATGTWNATTISIAKGGTGLTALGSANTLLGANAAGNAAEYKAIFGTANQITVVHDAGSITLSTPQSIATTSNVTFGSVTSTGAFGCNGATARTSATVPAAITATAGATYTATEQGMLNDVKAMVNAFRTALINNGIAV